MVKDYIKWHNGIYIRKGIVGRDNDAWLIIENIYHDEYKLKSIPLNNIRLIYDIGASIGVFAIVAHQLFPCANITCVDPNPNTIELLKLNTKGFANVINGCISYDQNDVYMVFSKQDFDASVSSNPKEKSCKVQSYKLSEIMPGGCDLLKIDCEGMEYDIFEKEDLSNVRYIIGEWHNTSKWYSFLINYIAKNNYWSYSVIKDHDYNGNFYMRNMKYE